MLHPNQQSPTIAAAIADLQRQGFRLHVHFTPDTALQLRADLIDARSTWDALGRNSNTPCADLESASQ